MKFRFTFLLGDSEVILREFPLNCSEDRAWEILGGIYDDFTEPLECKYGVHDADGDGKEYVGYTTYEVRRSKIDELMGIWKTKLKEFGVVDS
tara:strand:+ start:232 stop:507 length:276 start_codon:yes stop_codon:yes gene_type:complete